MNRFPSPVLLCPVLGVFGLLLSGCGGDTRTFNADPTSPMVIGDDATCPTCTIELREIALLGSETDPSSFRPNAAGLGCMVGVTEGGDFLVSGMLEPGRIYRYGPNGTLLRRIGRQGEGPGEFGPQIRLWMLGNDSVLVQDDALRRVSVMSQEGEFARSFPSPGRDGFAVVDENSLVYFTRALQPGDPVFARITLDGTGLVQFEPTHHPEPDIDTRMVFPAREGGFWSAGVWRYELHLRDTNGAIVRSVRREAPWFPPDGTFSDEVYVSEPPPPFFNHLWEAPEGQLWTYSLVPDPDWEPGLGLRPDPEWYRRTFDTVIEVLDLADGAVVARTRYDGRLGHVCGSHLMYTVVESGSEDTRMQLLEPVLVEPSR